MMFWHDISIYTGFIGFTYIFPPPSVYPPGQRAYTSMRRRTSFLTFHLQSHNRSNQSMSHKDSLSASSVTNCIVHFIFYPADLVKRAKPAFCPTRIASQFSLDSLYVTSISAYIPKGQNLRFALQELLIASQTKRRCPFGHPLSF